MADNTELNKGQGGDFIASDEIAGIKHQLVKMEFGVDGVAIPVSTADPMPVQHQGALTVSGTIAVSNLPGTQSVSGTVAISNLPATQPVSGTIGVNNFPTTQAISVASLPLPTNAATSGKQDSLLTELQLKADLTETQPVSLASVPSHPVTNAGTFAVQAKLVDSAGVNAASIDSNGALAVQSGGVTGAAVPLRAIQIAGSDGTNLQSFKTDANGNQIVREIRSTTGGITTANITTSSSTALSLNTNRKGAMFQNEGASTVYLKFGATASITSYTVQIVSGGYYELPFNYTGILDAITSTGTAILRITELT